MSNRKAHPAPVDLTPVRDQALARSERMTLHSVQVDGDAVTIGRHSHVGQAAELDYLGIKIISTDRLHAIIQRMIYLKSLCYGYSSTLADQCQSIQDDVSALLKDLNS